MRKAYQAYDPDGRAAQEIRDLTQREFEAAFHREVERRAGASAEDMRATTRVALQQTDLSSFVVDSLRSLLCILGGKP